MSLVVNYFPKISLMFLVWVRGTAPFKGLTSPSPSALFTGLKRFQASKINCFSIVKPSSSFSSSNSRYSSPYISNLLACTKSGFSFALTFRFLGDLSLYHFFNCLYLWYLRVFMMARSVSNTSL